MAFKCIDLYASLTNDHTGKFCRLIFSCHFDGLWLSPVQKDHIVLVPELQIGEYVFSQLNSCLSLSGSLV
jgi:hypothetical protein